MSVELRNDEYIVSANSQTEAGFWISVGTPFRLPDSAPAGKLGQVIRDALSQSQQGVPTPPRDADSPARPLLDLLGLPDYASYMKGARSVEVYAEGIGTDESIEVTPKRNEGARGGFTTIDEQAKVFPYDSPGQLGTEVIRAFDKAL
ncbi:MAG: hypothetical protein DLM61_07055 [Pseudonocardiales bacterium]|nr:MAG: hypothetical protein DLM61_07055 [Pseudonocardiales bacterium]